MFAQLACDLWQNTLSTNMPSKFSDLLFYVCLIFSNNSVVAIGETTCYSLLWLILKCCFVSSYDGGGCDVVDFGKCFLLCVI